MIDPDSVVMAGRIIGSLLLIIAGIQLLAPIADLDPWRVMVLFGAALLVTSAIGTHYFVTLFALCLALLIMVLRSVL